MEIALGLEIIYFRLVSYSELSSRPVPKCQTENSLRGSVAVVQNDNSWAISVYGRLPLLPGDNIESLSFLVRSTMYYFRQRLPGIALHWLVGVVAE